MARPKTIGQARELARQSANFYGVTFLAWIAHDGTPRVRQKGEVSDRELQGLHVETYDPAEERPNELDRRELAAVRAGLYLLSRIVSGPAGLNGEPLTIASSNGKQNPLTAEEIERLQERLMVTRK